MRSFSAATPLALLTIAASGVMAIVPPPQGVTDPNFGKLPFGGLEPRLAPLEVVDGPSLPASTGSAPRPGFKGPRRASRFNARTIPLEINGHPVQPGFVGPRTIPLEINGHPVPPGFVGPREPEPAVLEPGEQPIKLPPGVVSAREPQLLEPGEQPIKVPPGAVAAREPQLLEPGEQPIKVPPGAVAVREPQLLEPGEQPIKVPPGAVAVREPVLLEPGEQPLTNLPPGAVAKTLARAVANYVERRYLEAQLD